MQFSATVTSISATCVSGLHQIPCYLSILNIIGMILGPTVLRFVSVTCKNIVSADKIYIKDFLCSHFVLRLTVTVYLQGNKKNMFQVLQHLSFQQTQGATVSLLNSPLSLFDWKANDLLQDVKIKKHSSYENIFLIQSSSEQDFFM